MLEFANSDNEPHGTIIKVLGAISWMPHANSDMHNANNCMHSKSGKCRLQYVISEMHAVIIKGSN